MIQRQPANAAAICVLLSVATYSLNLTGRNNGLVTLRHHQYGVLSLRKSRDDVTVNVTLEDPGPIEYIVRQHEEASLYCEVTNGTLGQNLRWLHNGIEVERGHRYTHDIMSGRLIISSVRLEDDGVWQCEERDSAASIRPISLIVLDPPRPPYLLIDGRRLDPGNLFIPVKENTDLTVECISEGGKPNPTLHWILLPSDGHIDTTPALQLSNDSTHPGPGARSEARIARVLRAHHNATVSCLVNHVTLHNSMNASLLLDVQYTPSFGISRVPDFGFPLREGIPVSLKCDVDSNPPANPVWQKDDGMPPVEQSGDGFLNFTSIRRDHSGWYKCTTRHLLGDFSSIGYFVNVRYDAPELEVTPMDGGVSEEAAVEVTLGGAVQLQCPAGASGCWSRVGKDGSLDPIGPGPKLSLDRILYQEAGEYRCVVARSARLEQWRAHNVHVSVSGGPVVYPSNTTLLVSIGHRVDIAVEFCANPPASKAIWLTETRLIKPGTTDLNIHAHHIADGSSVHCHQAVLTINSVRPIDHGEYIFFVKSPHGIAEATTILNVTWITDSALTSSSPQNHIILLLVIVYGILTRIMTTIV